MSRVSVDEAQKKSSLSFTKAQKEDGFKWKLCGGRLQPVDYGMCQGKHDTEREAMRLYSKSGRYGYIQQEKAWTGIKREKNILFGAMLLTDERKGMDLLIKALDYLPREQYLLSVVGEADRKIFDGLEFEYHFYGRIDSQERMAEIYNEADVYVIPSRQENLSNSVTEAMACGVPVVAFDVGGMADMIVHRVNGYLAKAFDCKELAEGIMFCIECADALAVKAEELTTSRFSMEAVGIQYRQLCSSLKEK